MTGFIPVKRNSNTVYTAGVSRYYVPSTDATALYLGDPVALAGSADALGKYPTVTLATLTANSQWLGVVVAVLPVSDELKTTTPNLDRIYRPASTAAYILVADDPDQEFIIGEDAAGAAIAAADVGNLGIAVTASANTSYGRSGIVLDSSSFVSGTATGQLKLLGLVDRADLILGTGTTAGALFRVKINEAMHELATPATTEP